MLIKVESQSLQYIHKLQFLTLIHGLQGFNFFLKVVPQEDYTALSLSNTFFLTSNAVFLIIIYLKDTVLEFLVMLLLYCNAISCNSPSTNKSVKKEIVHCTIPYSIVIYCSCQGAQYYTIKILYLAVCNHAFSVFMLKRPLMLMNNFISYQIY